MDTRLKMGWIVLVPAGGSFKIHAVGRSGNSRRVAGAGLRQKTGRGSALVLVVALLVLLALIGTALLTTTATERHTAAQHSNNTETDLLFNGVVEIVQASLVEDLFSRGSGDDHTYRGVRAGSQSGKPYDHADGATSGEITRANDGFLAERVPDYSGGAYRWGAISAPAVTGTAFVSPFGTSGSNGRRNVTPTSIRIGGTLYPALDFGGGVILPAADTDGDGIADAGYFSMPVGSLNGISYFAAIRIIDNLSAINLSIASRAQARDGEPSWGPIFPSQVDLQGVLRGAPPARAGQLDALNLWRGGDAGFFRIAVSDAGVSASDFEFTSDAETLWAQLGRRLEDPGFNGPGRRFRAIARSSEIALAFPFGIQRGGRTPERVEQLLGASLIDGERTVPWLPDQASTPGGWGDSTFGYQKPGVALDAAAFSRRALVTCRNPVSNAVEMQYPRPADVAGMAPVREAETKTSLNSASFTELWKAFRDVMCDAGGASPFGAAGAGQFDPYNAANPQRMFRSSIRALPTAGTVDGGFDARTTRFAPEQQLLLRAALAAVNAMDLRDSDADVTAQTIRLTAMLNGLSTPVDVTVYGTEEQPYITEVYANTENVSFVNEGEPNPKGYVAVELHNPYPYDLDVSHYQLGVIDRRSRRRGDNPQLHIRPLTGSSQFGTFGNSGQAVVPAQGYLILENYTPVPGAGDEFAARYRPNASGLATFGVSVGALPGQPRRQSVYVRNLHEVFEDTTPSAIAPAGGELVLLRPLHVDGSPAGSGDDAEYSAGRGWNLDRMAPVDQHDFTGLAIHPPVPPQVGVPQTGDFAAYHYARANGDEGNARWKFVYPGRYDARRDAGRHEGGQITRFYAPGQEPSGGAFFQRRLGVGNPTATYANPFPAVQVNNVDWGGPNGMLDASTGTPRLGPGRFPSGQFMRIGDVLQVPFIGSYSVRIASTQQQSENGFLELNSLPMDCAFADDADPSTDAFEHLGRFCPFRAPAGSTASVDDFNPNAPSHYRWALRVLDQFTTLDSPDHATDPTSAFNGDALAGVEGRVNVNTAPWPVLAALQLVPGGEPAEQAELARAIVRHRTEHGPFKNLFELDNVHNDDGSRTFRNGWGRLDTAADFDDVVGDVSPQGPGTDGVIGDFEQEFLMVNRASNLLTTRSDSFTCYIVLEGWRNAGSPLAVRVAERRGAVNFDRSRVRPDRSGMSRTWIPGR